MSLAVLLLLAGAAVLAYPAVSNYVNGLYGSYAIQRLREQVAGMESGELAAQRALAEAYNAGGTDTAYEDILNFGGGIMGYLSIPKIGVYLPIYHGTGDQVLAKGVGHLPESAFPIGGAGNHAVLTGHTGLPSAELFTDLTELEAGDVFTVHILEGELTYRVDQILVVLPGETEGLAAVTGEDYCTLVTCTPYGINSHRLLVRGARVEPGQDAPAGQSPQDARPVPLWPPAALGAGLLLGLAAVVCVIRKRKGVKER